MSTAMPPSPLNKSADAPKKMYIMRGVSGSGKSTKARQLQGGGKVFSTDDYFMEGGEYKHDVSKLGEAHAWNQRRVWEAAHNGVTPIVVDNTTTQAWEAKPYVVVGLTEGYEVEIVEPDSPWWKQFRPGMSDEELEELAKVLTEKTIHGVPFQGVLAMLKRWEFDLDPMKILRSQKPEWKKKVEQKPAQAKAATMSQKVPQYIKVNGQLYKCATRDPEVTNALTALSIANNKFNSAKTPEEISDAKGDLYEAAQQLAKATR